MKRNGTGMVGKICRPIIVIVLYLLFIQVVCTAAVYLVYTTLGIGGAGDWTYRELPGSYEIFRSHAYNIVVYDADTKDTVIPSYVTQFSYNEGFIGIQQTPGWQGETPIEEERTVYYLINAESKAVYGPFELETFQSFCDENSIRLGLWIKTVPKPDGAVTD